MKKQKFLITPKGEAAELYARCKKGNISAKERLLKKIKQNPKSAEWHFMMITWYSANGQHSAADRKKEEMHRLFPENVFA